MAVYNRFLQKGRPRYTDAEAMAEIGDRRQDPPEEVRVVSADSEISGHTQ